MRNIKIDGIWIVVEHKGDSITIQHFNNLIRDEEVPVKKITMDHLKGPLVGGDGKEIDVEPGALLQVTKQNTEVGLSFHMANVGPSNTATALQVEYAKSKLGLGLPPKISGKILAADGQFRALLTGATKPS